MTLRPGAARAHPPLAARRPLAAGALGALLIAFSALLVQLSEASPATAAVFRCAYALPPLAVLAWRERRRYGPRPLTARAPALLAGLFFAADLVFWHYSITFVGTGLATVLANSQVVIVGLVAWVVLGERPEKRAVAAVPVMLVGVLLISGVAGGDAFGDRPTLGAVFGIITGIAYAGFLLTLRHGSRDEGRLAGPLLDASAVAAVASAVAGLALGDIDLVPAWPGHGWLLLLAMTSQVLAWLLIGVSLRALPAVVTSIVLMLQPAAAVAIGVLLVGETPSPAQYAGVVVVLAGIVVATVGRARSEPPPGPHEAAPVAEGVR